MRIGHEQVAATVEHESIPQARLIDELLLGPTGRWNLPDATAGHCDETFRLWSNLTPSGNVEEGKVPIVEIVPERVAINTECAKGAPMNMLPRLSRAMLSGRFGGDMVRTRVSPSLACAAGDKATRNTPANNVAKRRRRLTLILRPPFSPI